MVVAFRQSALIEQKYGQQPRQMGRERRCVPSHVSPHQNPIPPSYCQRFNIVAQVPFGVRHPSYPLWQEL